VLEIEFPSNKKDAESDLNIEVFRIVQAKNRRLWKAGVKFPHVYRNIYGVM